MIEINVIYNEDCMKTMQKMPNDFIDLVVTSPPYDNLRDYHGFHFDVSLVSRELFRVLKRGGVVVWVIGDATVNGSETGTSFRHALTFMETGFSLYDTMIYKKLNYIPLNHSRYEQAFEYMFVFSKGKPKTFNPLTIPCKTCGSSTNGRTFYQTPQQDVPDKAHHCKPVGERKTMSNVWEMPTNGGCKGHPAQFPEQLAKNHILSWSNRGELVYDPFIGSGTTAKMAIVCGRNWIGSEIDKTYCELARTRIIDVCEKEDERDGTVGGHGKTFIQGCDGEGDGDGTVAGVEVRRPDGEGTSASPKPEV